MPALNLSYNLTSTVGGLFGYGGSVSRSQVIFEKNHFTPGEIANIRIICDNSQCSKPIWAFKIKLLCFVEGNQTANSTKFSSYIHKIKEVGNCAAGGQADRTFQFKIPTDNEKLVKTFMDDQGKQAGENYLAMMALHPTI